MNSQSRKPLYLAIALAMATGIGLFPLQSPAEAAVTHPNPTRASSASPTESQPAAAPASQNLRINSTKTQSNTEKVQVAANTNGKVHQQIEAKLKAVIVTGFTQSVENALAQQRNANAIIDVINAQSVNQFPSKDVADALKRLPGVVVGEADGEGKTVSIRGLTAGLTLTQLNGNYVANAAATSHKISRSFNYSLLPAQLIASVDVYKSQQASLTAGGIGGTVILHTRKPLSLPSNSGYVSLKGTSSDTITKLEPRITGMYTWHNKPDNLGFLLGFGYQKRDVRDEQFHGYGRNGNGWGWWSPGESANNFSAQPPTFVDGKLLPDPQNVKYFANRGIVDQAGNEYSGFWMPQQLVARTQTDHRIRRSLQLTAQYSPVHSFQLTANYFRFGMTNNSYHHNIQWVKGGIGQVPFSSDQGNLLAPNGLQFNPQHNIVTSVKYMTPKPGIGCNAPINPNTGAMRSPASLCANRWPLLAGGMNLQSATSQTVNLKGVWSKEGDFISFDFGRSWSSGGDRLHLRYGVNPNIFRNGHWVNSSNFISWSIAGKPTISFSPDLLSNILAGDSRMNRGLSPGGIVSTTKSSANFGEINAILSPDINWIDSIKVGIKYTDQHGSNFNTQVEWFCPGTTLEFQICGDNTQRAAFYFSHSLKANNKVFSLSQFPAIAYSHILGYLDATYGSPQPFNQSPLGSSDLQIQHEAAYTQLDFQAGALRGNVGVRAVRMIRNVDVGAVVTTDLQNFYQNKPGPGGIVLVCPPSGKNKVGATCTPGNPELRPVIEWNLHAAGEQHSFSSHLFLLPSLNVVYKLPAHVELRGAWSMAMSPPSYGELASGAHLTHFTQAWYDSNKQFSSGATLPGWYGSASNPSRKALKARQYDLGAAWYPVRGSVLSLNYFHKRISNFAVPVTLVNSPVQLNHKTETVNVFSTIGNGETSNVRGFEFDTQYVSPVGLGVLANYTRLKSHNANVTVNDKVVGTSKLTGSADYTGNFSLFYQRKRLLFRVSENWVGTIVDGLYSGLTRYIRPYKQIDVNAHYKVTPHVMIQASVINVNGAIHKIRLGDDTLARIYSANYNGRQYYLGFTYSFGG